MICDKCGFEHNSKSVCPKCGARVVFVNEDYLRRKKEWEEAQKNPEAGNSILPGIMFSTREDNDRRHGNDRVTELNDKFQDDGKKDRNKGKGRSAMTRLSFDALKEKIQNAILKAAEKTAAFIRKHKKRRGADNPVIRELKFDDSSDSFDDSPAVVEHKVFHGVRRPAILAVALVAGAAVIAVAAVNIVRAVKNRDRSRVFIYDGTNGYYAGSEDAPALTSDNGKMTISQAGEGCFIACGESRLIIFRNGKVYSVDADKASIVAYNDGLDTVVYTENGKTMVTDGKDTKELVFNSGAVCGDYTEDCGISDDGRYIFLITCSGSEDFSAGEYGVYFGTAESGMDTVRESSEGARVVGISDEGTAVYEDMDNAAYGIVNGRRLMTLHNGESRMVAEDISRVQYDFVNDTVYYIDDGGNLYMYDTRSKMPATVPVAENADDIKVPSMGEYAGGMVYRCGTGYYYVSGGSEGQYLFTCSSDPEIYIKDNSEFWYYDGNCLYHKGRKDGEAVAVAENVAFAGFMYDGSYAYLADGSLHYYDPASEKTVILADEVDGINDINVSKKSVYFLNSANILYSVSKKGKALANLGQAEFILTVR